MQFTTDVLSAALSLGISKAAFCPIFNAANYSLEKQDSNSNPFDLLILPIKVPYEIYLLTKEKGWRALFKNFWSYFLQDLPYDVLNLSLRCLLQRTVLPKSIEQGSIKSYLAHACIGAASACLSLAVYYPSLIIQRCVNAERDKPPSQRAVNGYIDAISKMSFRQMYTGFRVNCITQMIRNGLLFGIYYNIKASSKQPHYGFTNFIKAQQCSQISLIVSEPIGLALRYQEASINQQSSFFSSLKTVFSSSIKSLPGGMVQALVYPLSLVLFSEFGRFFASFIKKSSSKAAKLLSFANFK